MPPPIRRIPRPRIQRFDLRGEFPSAELPTASRPAIPENPPASLELPVQLRVRVGYPLLESSGATGPLTPSVEPGLSYRRKGVPVGGWNALEEAPAGVG